MQRKLAFLILAAFSIYLPSGAQTREGTADRPATVADSLYFGPDGSFNSGSRGHLVDPGYEPIAREEPRAAASAPVAPAYVNTAFNREEITQRMRRGRRILRQPGEKALVHDRLVRAGRENPDDQIMKIGRVPY